MNPYRTALFDNIQSIAINCTKCGFLSIIKYASKTFTCSACKLEQPLVPADSYYEPFIFECTSLLPRAAYKEFLPFLSAIGATPIPCMHVMVLLNGLPMEIDVDVNSGTLVGLSVTISTNYFPKVSFRTEDPTDVQAATSEVVCEITIGDQAFDNNVYIDTDAHKESIHILLSALPVRRAIQELALHFRTINFDKNSIRLKNAIDGLEIFNPQLLIPVLKNLRILAGAPRSTETTYHKKSTAYLRSVWYV